VIEPNTPYWSSPLGDLLADLNTSDAGLSSEEATRRLAQVGPNTLKTKKKTGSLGLGAANGNDTVGEPRKRG
jgi:magnesium-transporting ATPase (P-type)